MTHEPEQARSLHRVDRARPHPRRVAAVAVLALLAATAGCKKKDAAPPTAAQEIARSVSVARVELRAIRGHAEAVGLLVPREEAAVSSELSGYRVAEVLVEEGAIVKKGDVLARLDDTLLRARIAQARASAEQAQGEAKRVEGLDGTGVLSDEDIAQRRSQSKVAEAQLNDLTTQAEQLTLRAPVAGVVLERNLRPGAVAAAGGDPMFRIARDQLIELDAEISEESLAGISVGSKAHVTLPSGLGFDGEVRLVLPTIDPQTKLGRVRVRLPVNPALRAGGFAQATFDAASQPVPSVPEKAIQFEASGPQLTVIDKDNRARRMAVRTGARANGYVELLEGPAAGTQVALGGGAFLLDGDLVDPASVSPAPAPAAAAPAPKP